MEKLKAYFKKNPYMGFAAVILVVTIVLGIVAFAATRPPAEEKEKTETTEEKEVLTEDTSDSMEEDDTASEHKAKPTVAEEEDEDEDVTPTKGPTSAPTNTPGPTATTSYKINILGDVFSDDNCNGSQDSGENRIKDIVVNLYKEDGSAYSSTKTDGSGHYSYDGTVNKGDQLTLKIQPVAADNYTIRDSYKSANATVSEGSPSKTNNFPMVPSDKVSACQ